MAVTRKRTRIQLLTAKLEKGDLMWLITNDTTAQPMDDVLVTHVDFSTLPTSQRGNPKYEISISDDIRHLGDLACIFPYHRTEKMRVLFAGDYNTVHALNDAVNRRILETGVEYNFRFAVVRGNYVFKCTGLKGTVYILPTNSVKKTYQASNIVNAVHEKNPVIANYTGEGEAKSFFMIPDEVITVSATGLPRIPGDTTLYMPANMMPFTHEVQHRKPAEKRIAALSAESVAHHMDDLSKPQQVHTPAAGSAQAASSGTGPHAIGMQFYAQDTEYEVYTVDRYAESSCESSPREGPRVYRSQDKMPSVFSSSGPA